MPNRTGSAGHTVTAKEKSPKVTRIEERKSDEKEFELLLRSAARLKATAARTQKKESAA